MNPEETNPPVGDFLDALQQSHWPVAVGLGIALAIYAANRANLLKSVPSTYTPALAAALGILSAIGTQLSTGMSWEEALGKGFLAGAAATGLWEMVLKHVLKFPKRSEDSPKGSEEPAPKEEPRLNEPKSEPPPADPAPVEGSTSTSTEANPSSGSAVRRPRKRKAAEKPPEGDLPAASAEAAKVVDPVSDTEPPPPPKRKVGRPRKKTAAPDA